MIRVPRAFARMACLIIWVLVMYAIRLVCMPIRIVSKPAEAQSRRAVLRLCSKGVLAILGMRVEVRGRPPTMPYLLVSNHLAAVDIFVLGSLLGPLFISQGDVAHWPLVGLVARAADTLFIDRTRLKDIVRVNQLIVDKFRDGEGIVFFPESTTSEDGNLLPFKTALFEAPVQAELPVHYMSLSYGAPPGGPTALETIVWRDPVSFFGHFVRIALLPRSKAIVVFGEHPIAGDNRKVLARKLQEAVQAGRPPLE
ncbi:MAG: 1-acyl-sn-glycerol-3-phosphate acyltransferase [Candidatus Hydrogenedentes bacterium]|nr:1-acyl-sn-glycerol-3-phosphate acyltransferase [Candidatus Hydrogenedentota bacterium]